MKSSITKGFRRLFEDLPDEVQTQTVKGYRLWRSNPNHPGLQFKRVSNSQPIYSVRVGIGYRALGLRDGETIYWFWIAPHAEYDALLKRLS